MGIDALGELRMGAELKKVNALMGLDALGELQRSKRPTTYYLPASCTILQMGRLVWRLSMMTLWTGSKIPH